MDGSEIRVLQGSPLFDQWLYGPQSGNTQPRNDGWRTVGEVSQMAIAARKPIHRTATGLHGERIETRDLLAMPLGSRWFTCLVLFYVSEPTASYGVTDQVYQSTRDGFLMLAPIRDIDGRVSDFEVVSVNPGASALLGIEASMLLWCRWSAMPNELRQDGVQRALREVLNDRAPRNFELEIAVGSNESCLAARASLLDDLIFLTLTDVTELKAREAGFRLMFEANPVPMCLVDAESMQFLDVNVAAVAHYGHLREQFLGMSHYALLHPDEHAAFRDVAADPARTYEGERSWRHLTSDGSEIHVRPYARRFVFRKRSAALVAFVDVTSSQKAEADLRRAQVFLDTVIENIPSALFVKDAETRNLLLVNKAGEDMLGVTRSEAIGKPTEYFFSDGTGVDIRDHDRRALQLDHFGAVIEEKPYAFPGRETRVLNVKKLALPDGEGHVRYLLGIAEDITERRRIEKKIAHMAHHDALTDLPNRTLFAAQLEAALAQVRRSRASAAVLGLDLDDFKAVNDTLGHSGGDELLQLVGRRISDCLRREDLVARLGGDEFAILQVAPTSAEEASKLAERLVSELTRPFTIMDQEIRIGASVGVAIAPEDGDDPETLLRHADLALYRAKDEGKSNYRFFEPEMNARLQKRRELERDLRKALERGDFELHYQPLITIRDQRVCGCEALLRWKHPEHGYVQPGEFISLAEETGLIAPIGEWVLRRACEEASRWPSPLTVAVNVSPAQFRSSHLVATVLSALAASGLDPNRLEIEITESVLLMNSDANLATLHALRGLGVKIAMDDFGTGYSSLAYLSNFSFDKIKIDRSFVRQIGMNRHCEAIISVIVKLGAHLAIVTVGEGVETAEQLAHLQQEGCDQAQGFLLSRPLSTSDLRLFLNNLPGLRVAA
ncbi:sensor domain-containing protein [Lichenifustis flavocetrariae]|uniref:EAL domain-containing protein n=1 Tax=Lichenifustis flavocetrariae TaxID=2949735 RepID=A0AA41Z5L4_9HYPH|nr:bifunctional diguanylate cyclase/phosphodiesterase [Lichenifustis flavocetrariae]MCW6510750.1 EAL domain-containing protein [Lichenifustis flavocetrariae]